MKATVAVAMHLDISLHHLPAGEVGALQREAETTRHLDGDGLAAGTALPATTADAYGYWVNVPDAGDPDELERRRAFPVLDTVLRHARELHCSWVHLDRDAEPDPALPLYD